MVAPPLGPMQVVLALGILGLGHEQQQTPYLGHG
jgi:hypothetical protein